MENFSKNIHFVFFFKRVNAIGAHFLKKQNKTKLFSHVQSIIWKPGVKVYADNAFMIELFVY